MITLGIDTGGTYTDTVIYDRKTSNVLAKNKSLTTNYNLTVGITNAINGLEDRFFKKIQLVALSTTLATNAIVEGKGARVGLLLLGYDHQLLKKFDSEKEMSDKRIEIIKGKFNVKGEEIEELDKDRIKKIGLKWKPKVDVFAVSGYMGIRNPKHEVNAREILNEITGLPVVCGHFLTNKLNSIKRATTVYLNAKLIPLIQQLNQKIKQVLKERGINAPLMVVKGDGSLVRDKIISEKPIETVASGPAASIIGARNLSQIRDGIIVDMGGTTTDIALINNGYPELDSNGAVIGGQRSSVEAIEFRTIGLGGDSQIKIDKYGNLDIGPKRVIPYSLAAYKNEEVLTELNELKNKNTNLTKGEFLILDNIDNNIKFNKQEKRILDILKSGPKSIDKIVNQLENTTPDFLQTKRLEKLGIIKRIGLTPTDLLHIINEYNQWNKEAAEIGLEFFLSRKNQKKQYYATQIKNEVIKNCAQEILIKLFKYYYKNNEKNENGFKNNLANILVDDRDHPWNFDVDLPIVAVGAPAGVYLKELHKFLNTDVILKENFEIANAIGAAMGNVLIKEEILIRPNMTEGNYFVYSKKGREKIDELEEAINYGEKLGKKIAIKKAEAAGARKLKTNVNIKRKEAGGNFEEEKQLIEVKIEIIISGLPKMN